MTAHLDARYNHLAEGRESPSPFLMHFRIQAQIQRKTAIQLCGRVPTHANGAAHRHCSVPNMSSESAQVGEFGA